MASSTPNRVWLITGCSSGFGRAFAQAVIVHGDQLVATARNVEQIAQLASAHPDQVLALALDVTNPQQAQATVESALNAFGHIDVLVNNAGYGLFGAFEELSDEQIRRQIEVNLFGVMNITRAVLPAMRAQRSGHLLQMSSLGGQAGFPGNTAYAASKFALEGWSEALSKELAPFGIKVTIIEPGGFRTEWAGRSMVKATPLAIYDEVMSERRANTEKVNGKQPGDPARAAQAIIAVVEAEQPPMRLPLGTDSASVIRQHLQQQLNELDRWESLSHSTDFPHH
ncbi:SDR family NAD(P)-dependent oxidoreductase [Ktedonosporobacter rubrisoli]|uniref:SDR family NAD(P)-dependent oxidoreductase n=1 Tax=Ktedonosporobacter rubrisoli TaxID=2509675 RepID=A0A4P6JXQ7_KTERU|nr:oxidoreductase [Ktedonosporobacter rubrisoli]QBD80222.1 SDR family NAD(P)-dependent oxidoreductase [Ktedonosporobacter rubrisoli]